MNKNYVCNWDGCDRPANGSKGFCRRDYLRSKKLGHPDKPWELFESTRTNKDSCKWPGCERKIFSRGFCKRDYQRSNSLGHPDNPWDLKEFKEISKVRETACKWPECNRNDIVGRGLCSRDYLRSKKEGHPEEPWKTWSSEKLVYVPELKCIWPECGETLIDAKRMCHTHYCRSRVLGHPDNPWDHWEQRCKEMNPDVKCIWPGCGRDASKVTKLCGRDYERARSLGFPEDPWNIWYAKGNKDRIPTNETEEGMNCTKCGVFRLYSEFNYSRRTSNGLTRNCKECLLKMRREYLKRNPSRNRIIAHRRKSRERNAFVEDVSIYDVVKRDGTSCSYCGIELSISSKETHMDHFIPLYSGGLNCLDNMVLACSKCNLSKSKYSAHDFISRQEKIGRKVKLSPYVKKLMEEDNLDFLKVQTS